MVKTRVEINETENRKKKNREKSIKPKAHHWVSKID